jgi:undecaprenyl-diphosphatase
LFLFLVEAQPNDKVLIVLAGIPPDKLTYGFNMTLFPWGCHMGSLKSRPEVMMGFGLFLLFLIWTWIVNQKFDWLTSFDQKGQTVFYGFGGPHLSALWAGITHLGDFSFCLIMGVLIGLVFAYFKRGLTGGVFVLGLIGAKLSTDYFKKWVGRPRPKLSHLLARGPFSYPSGHMTYATFFYGFLLVLLMLLILHNGKRQVAWLFGLVLILYVSLIGLSRLVLGDHNPSDVVGGFLLGSSWLVVCFSFLKVARKKGFR